MTDQDQSAIQPAESKQAQLYERLELVMESLLPYLPDEPDGIAPISKSQLLYAKFSAALIFSSGMFRPDDVSFGDLWLLSMRATLNGFDPTEVVENLYIIKDNRGGRPKIGYDVSLLLAKVLQSGVLSELHMPDTEQVRKEKKATVTAVRKDNGMRVSMTFSMDDVADANLGGKNNWKGYWPQMLINRALTIVLRKIAADVLKGAAKYIPEEVTDHDLPMKPNGDLDTPSRVIIDMPQEAKSVVTQFAQDEIEVVDDVDEEIVDEVDVEPDEIGDIPAEFDPLVVDRPDVDEAPGPAPKSQVPAQKPADPQPAKQPEPETKVPEGWANKDNLRWIANTLFEYINPNGGTKAENIETTKEIIEITAEFAFDPAEAGSYPAWNKKYASREAALDACKGTYDRYWADNDEDNDESDWTQGDDYAQFTNWVSYVFGLSVESLLSKIGKKTAADLGSNVNVAKETAIMAATMAENNLPVLCYDAKYGGNHVVYRTPIGKVARDYGNKAEDKSGRDRLRDLGPDWAAFADNDLSNSFVSLPEPLMLSLEHGNNYYKVTHVQLLQAEPA